MWYVSCRRLFINLHAYWSGAKLIRPFFCWKVECRLYSCCRLSHTYPTNGPFHPISPHFTTFTPFHHFHPISPHFTTFTPIHPFHPFPPICGESGEWGEMGWMGWNGVKRAIRWIILSRLSVIDSVTTIANFWVPNVPSLLCCQKNVDCWLCPLESWSGLSWQSTDKCVSYSNRSSRHVQFIWYMHLLFCQCTLQDDCYSAF